MFVSALRCRLRVSLTFAQGYDYNNSETLESDIPEQTLRLCFRYGITTVDTSPYYT